MDNNKERTMVEMTPEEKAQFEAFQKEQARKAKIEAKREQRKQLQEMTDSVMAEAVAELMDDSNELFVFDLNGGDVKAVSELSFTKPLVDFGEDNYGVYKWVHPDHLVLGSRFDMMSTFNASRAYFVGSDGMPDTNQEFYYVLTDAAYEPLVAKTDIPCVFIDEAGDVVEEDAVIPAGDNLWNYRTNGENIYDVKLSDGTIARLNVEDGEESRQINGVDIDELVEMTYYAG